MKFFVFKKIKKIDKRFYYLAAFFIFLILAGYFMFGKNGGGLAAIDYGGANANLRGFAWSETAGWISFNAKDCDTNGDGYVDTGNCGGAGNASTPTYNYGVTIATSSTEKGYVYGYAWSSNFGWISFNKKTCQSGIDIGKFCLTSGDCDSSASCLDSANGAIGTPPSAPYNDESNYTAFYDYNTNQLRGWGKALGMGNNGWIRMEDTSDISANGLIFYQSFNYADADWNNKKGLDRSGVSPANDLSFYGVNKPAKGKIGWGLELDGTNYASTAIQNGSQLDIDSNPITMSAWVKIDVLGAGSNSDNRDIIGRGSFADDGFGINLNGNLINLGRHGGGNFNGNTQVTTNKWYFITGIINGANSKIYINGQLDGTGTVDVKPSAGDLLIGGLSVGATTPYFDGIVDEVRIYNRVLSDDEIMRLYQNGVYLDNNGEFNGWAWSGLKINVCDSGVRAGKECSVDTDCSAFTSGSLCNQQTFDSGIGWMSLNAKNCDTDGNGFVDASSFINSSTAIFENNILDNLQETNDITSATLPNGNIVISYIDTSYQGKFFIVNRSGSIVKSPTIFSSNIRTSYSSGVPVIPLSNGNFALFFLDNNSTDDGTFMIYGSGGDLIKDKTIFETATINHFSATHLNNGNFLIAYSTLSGLDRFIIYDSLGNIIKDKTPFSFIG